MRIYSGNCGHAFHVPELRISGGDVMPRDPVCGMNVGDKGSLKSEFKGQSYYFCSDKCKAEFDRKPENYVSKEEKRDQNRQNLRNKKA